MQQFFLNGGTQAYVVRAPRTGALGAQVVLASLAFTALSSGSWANGRLIVDVDYNNLYQNVTGTVALTVNSPNVTGTGTSFQSSLKAGQFLVFAADPTNTPYQILSILSDTSLKLTVNYAQPAAPSTTAIVSADPTGFNLTVTNLVDGTAERFPNVSLNANRQNYVVAVVNDPDNGSQLVGLSLTGPAPTNPPAMTGIVGAATIAGKVVVATTGSTLAGTVALTNSATVAGTGTAFKTALQVGQSVVFAADPTFTQYQVSAIANNTSLTLSSKYGGPPAASSAMSALSTGPSTDFGIRLSVSSPPTAPTPLPLDIKVFPNNAPMPQTGSGLAAQLQRAINAALAVQMPGASVVCSVSAIGTSQSIRVNALIPQFPDAVVTIGAPSGPPGAGTLIGLILSAAMRVRRLQRETISIDRWAFNEQRRAVRTIGYCGMVKTRFLCGYALDKVDLFNLLCIPDATRSSAGNPSALDSTVNPNAIFGAAIAMCDRRRAFLLLDVPPNVNTVSGAVDYKTSGLTVHGQGFSSSLRGLPSGGVSVCCGGV